MQATVTREQQEILNKYANNNMKELKKISDYLLIKFGGIY